MQIVPSLDFDFKMKVYHRPFKIFYNAIFESILLESFYNVALCQFIFFIKLHVATFRTKQTRKMCPSWSK